MTPSNLLEIRLLPPMAIARFGAAAEPMDNYEVHIPNDRRLDWREVTPAPTFLVEPLSGEITDVITPKRLSFKDQSGLIRPVAPFFELWGRFDDKSFVPLTLDHLRECEIEPSALRWSVHVANHKAFRRTAKDEDKIECRPNAISDHKRYELRGECKNFVKGKFIPFGFVQYIKPTDRFKEIRFRFTPAGGYVYGPEGADPETLRAAVYKKDGPWANWDEKKWETPALNTNPGGIYWGGDDGKSRGFLDDACDGIIDVELDCGGPRLSSFARIMAGPPAFAPDSLPIRNILDELEMALHGPEVRSATNADVQEIVRRAFETVRLMNTTVMNGNPLPVRVSTMAGQDTGDFNRNYAPIMAPGTVDNLAVQAIHENIFATLESGTPPWFFETFRRYNEIGDLTDTGRRRMPAMMRGSDGRYLTLTRRQLDTIRKAASLSKSAANSSPTRPPAMP
jgi:hypothetical protein